MQKPLRMHRRLQLQSTLVPTRRQRAVSAAVVAPPPHRCSRDGHCGCPRCSARRDGGWWKPCHSTSTSPTRREATRTRRSSLPPDECTDPHGTHAHLAPDCAVGQAAAAASAAPIEPSTSAAQQPASPVRPLSACLPLHPPSRMRTRTLDRPSTRLRLQSGDAELAENASDAGYFSKYPAFLDLSAQLEPNVNQLMSFLVSSLIG